MKKRILMVLLVVALLVVAAAVTVQAADPTPYGDHTSETSICPHCNKAFSELSWTAVTASTTYSAGHYYVPAAGVTMTTDYKTLPNNTVVLFEGTLTAKDGYQAFRAGMSGSADSVKVWLLGAEGGKLTGTGATSNGALMRVGTAGKVTIDGDLTIELSASLAGTKDSRGLIDVIGNLIMEDGCINGMTSTASSSIAQHGGAIHLFYGASPKFTMNGGTINAGKIPGSKGFGAAIYLAKGTVELNGGTIQTTANTTTGAGRAIYTASGTTLKVQGTATVTEYEGNTSSYSLIYANGATQIGGSCTINGKVHVDDAGSLTISGAPQVIGAGINTNSTTAKITLGELTTTGTAPASVKLIVPEGSEGLALSVKNDALTQEMAYCFDVTLLGRSVIAKDGVMYVTTRDEHAEIMRFIANEEGEVWAECPLCRVNVQWFALNKTSITGLGTVDSHSTHGLNTSENPYSHFYFSEDTTLTQAGRIGIRNTTGNKTVCLNLNGATYQGANTGANMGMINVAQGSTLNIMGTGTVIGKSGPTYKDSGMTVTWYAGAAIDCRGSVNIYGGTFKSTAAKPVIALFTEGSSSSPRQVNMYGGTIEGSTSSGAGSAAVILNSSTHKFNMYGGTITGGHATNGGNVLVQGGTFTMEGGTITDGTATANGGAVCVGAAGTFTMKDGTISDSSANRGGAFYVVAGGRVNMSGGLVENCQVRNEENAHGGTAFVAGTFNMSGGTVNIMDFTRDTSRGFRVQEAGATLNLSGAATINGYGKTYRDIIDVVSTDATNPAKVTLAGQAKVTTAADATSSGVYLESNAGGAKLIVKEGWSGTFAFGHQSIINPEGTFLNTALVAYEEDSATEGSGFSGTLIFAEGEWPCVVAKENPAAENAIQLFVAGTQVITAEGATWHDDNAAAVAAYAELDVPAYIKLFTNDALDIGDNDVYINFNGKTVNVTGTGKLYGFDGTATVSKAGTAKVTGLTPEQESANPVYGYRYLALGDESGYTFHRFNVAVTKASLRPGTAGIYYKAMVECDDTLKGMIDTYGVAVSVANMPGRDFAMADSKALYTAIDKTKFVSGQEFTGVIINNILKNTDKDNDRADMDIYANAYVSFEIGGELVTVMADEDNVGKTKSDDGFTGVAKNLKEIVLAVDAMDFSKLEEDQLKALKKMYENFENTLQGWGLTKINNITIQEEN